MKKILLLVCVVVMHTEIISQESIAEDQKMMRSIHIWFSLGGGSWMCPDIHDATDMYVIRRNTDHVYIRYIVNETIYILVYNKHFDQIVHCDERADMPDIIPITPPDALKDPMLRKLYVYLYENPMYSEYACMHHSEKRVWEKKQVSMKKRVLPTFFLCMSG